MSEEKLKERLQKLIAEINDCAAGVKNNAIPDLSIWEEKAQTLCHDIGKAEDSIAKRLEQDVLEMIISLEKLSNELELFKNRMETNAEE
jgi:hypothetical protein